MPKQLPQPIDPKEVEAIKAEETEKSLKEIQDKYLQDEDGPAWTVISED